MIRQFRSNKAMTLVELILAIVLLNVVILTGLSMELGMRRIFSSTDLEAQLLAETVPIILKVTRDINQAVGDVTNVSNYAYTYIPSGGYNRYLIRSDMNFNGLADSGDRFAEYRYAPSTYILEFRPDSTSGGYTLLSDRVTAFSISPAVNGTSSISVTLRKDASLVANYTNPQITLNSNAQYRGYSYN